MMKWDAKQRKECIFLTKTTWKDFFHFVMKKTVSFFWYVSCFRNQKANISIYEYELIYCPINYQFQRICIFRLARQFTNHEDIVVIEDSFHGNLGILSDISPKIYQYIPNYQQKDFVHITPLPSSYRKSKLIKLDPETHYPKGLQGDDLHKLVAEMCAKEVERIFKEAKEKGRKIGAFICEPCMVSDIGTVWKLQKITLTPFFA